MTSPRIVVGERGAEIQALQVLALALSEQAGRLSSVQPADCRTQQVQPLLRAAARALSLASCGGLTTPIEVLALAARNTFELWLRLIHIAANEGNCQRWRDEGLTDQLQVLDAVLTLQPDESSKASIQREIERVKKHGVARSMNAGVRPKMAGDLAKDVGQEAEYRAFYKLYSKLVHPSSWSVNWPDASASDMYRVALAGNAQAYAWQILETVERLWGVSVLACYDAARAAAVIALSARPSRTLPHQH